MRSPLYLWLPLCLVAVWLVVEAPACIDDRHTLGQSGREFNSAVKAAYPVSR